MWMWFKSVLVLSVCMSRWVLEFMRVDESERTKKTSPSRNQKNSNLAKSDENPPAFTHFLSHNPK
jgi:hypothetical protein